MYLLQLEQIRPQGKPRQYVRGGSIQDLATQRGKGRSRKGFRRHWIHYRIRHGGTLPDDRKPGDIIVYNWLKGKHLLVDVAVTNPLAISHHPHLLAGGPGRTAKYREARKREKYRDLDTAKYTFIPFVIETTGAFGPAALHLCKRLREIKDMKCCKGADSPNMQTGDTLPTRHGPLQNSVSITVQRHNARMILERQPKSTRLIKLGIQTMQ